MKRDLYQFNFKMADIKTQNPDVAIGVSVIDFTILNTNH